MDEKMASLLRAKQASEHGGVTTAKVVITTMLGQHGLVEKVKFVGILRDLTVSVTHDRGTLRRRHLVTIRGDAYRVALFRNGILAAFRAIDDDAPVSGVCANDHGPDAPP